MPCNTWGPDQFLSYEDVLKSIPIEEQRSDNTKERYDAFGKDRGAYYWMSNETEFINNIEVIRWTINSQTPYLLKVSDIYDNEVYRTDLNDKVCGVILFPDSLLEEDPLVLKLSIRHEDNKFSLSAINFNFITLTNRNKRVRLDLLKEIQACPTLECKIEKLKSKNKMLDVFSLLELEKMKDPSNKSIDKLYWQLVSQIRYTYSGKSWER